MADDIEFLGDFSGFRFRVGDEVIQVEMDIRGFLVLNTKDDLVLRYGTWEEFKAAHPEVSVFMFQEIRRKMNETIAVVNQWAYQDAMPEVVPAPVPLEKDDMMFGRAYQ